MSILHSIDPKLSSSITFLPPPRSSVQQRRSKERFGVEGGGCEQREHSSTWTVLGRFWTRFERRHGNVDGVSTVTWDRNHVISGGRLQGWRVTDVGRLRG